MVERAASNGRISERVVGPVGHACLFSDPALPLVEEEHSFTCSLVFDVCVAGLQLRLQPRALGKFSIDQPEGHTKGVGGHD